MFNPHIKFEMSTIACNEEIKGNANFSVISKIIERVVKSRLIDHLTSSKLLNPHQSAYCKHHSTETALLYIHDHLINAVGSQKI